MSTMGPVSRRRLIQAGGAAGLSALFDRASANRVSTPNPIEHESKRAAEWDPTKVGAPFMRDPVWVYDNWSAYLEGIPPFANTPLTEELALAQLDQLIRLKQLGVHFDYYMMNAFWFARDGAYQRWRKDWSNGPDRWLARCKEHGLKPGLWFGTNCLWNIDLAPEWKDSYAGTDAEAGWNMECMSLHRGSFLARFMQALQYWYERGVRMFEFDAAYLDASSPEERAQSSREEIKSRNQLALSDALKSFRRAHPDVMLVAFNDFGGDIKSTAGPFPFKKPVDLRWLEVFDTLYSGDTRVSDVPQANFWRSVDLYNDHMVRRYEQSGVPLERIDPFCTFSTTAFGYKRGKHAWKGMVLLTLARGSWKKTVYGDLSLLSNADVLWFAKVQQMYAPLSAMGRTKSFGGVPGEVQPYGFGSFDIGGALYTVINPTQAMRTVELPVLSAAQAPLDDGRVVFRDSGFSPSLTEAGILLGPGQMAVVGFGRYARPDCDLGVQEDVIIPRSIQALATPFRSAGRNVIEATVVPPPSGDLRIIIQQRSAEDGSIVKDNAIRGRIEASQSGKRIPVDLSMDPQTQEHIELSWQAAEIRRRHVASGKPVLIRYVIESEKSVSLEGSLYAVEYS